MWRGENVKRRTSRKRGAKNKDAKTKKGQRKAPETTSVSRDSDDIRKTLSGEKSGSSKSLAPELRNARSKPDQENVAA